MRYYYTVTNGGDGSASIEWCESREVIEYLEEHDPETYGMGEGGSWIEVDGVITDIKPTTMEEAKEYLIEYGHLDED